MPRPASRRNHLTLERQQQRDRLRRQQQRDQRVLAALYNISLACRERPNFQAIFETLRRELASVFAYDAAYFAFCAERPEFFQCALLVDEDHYQFIEDVEYGHLTGQIVRSGQPLLFRDLLHERNPGMQTTIFGQTQKRSRAWMGVPLLIGRNSVGVISLQSYQVGIYTQESLDLLQRMANVIAVALENVALSERQERLSAALARQVTVRTQEIGTLGAIAAGMVARQPLPTMLEQALDVVLELFQMEAGNVRLLDEPREYLVLFAQRGFSAAYVDRTARSQLATSPIREVVATGQPTIITHGWREHYRASRPLTRIPFDIFPNFESSLILPLRINATVIGTLSLFGFSPRAFDDHEISLAQSVANQIAIMVENSRLLDARERQIRELEAIGQIGTLVTASYSLDHILAETYRILNDLTDSSVFYLLVCEPETRLITNAVFVEQGEWVQIDMVGRAVGVGTLSDWIITQREPLLFDDLSVQRDELLRRGIAPHPVGPANPVRSWAGVPLVARDGELIGVLSLQDYRPGRYDHGSLDFLGQVASHISLGVQKVRLFDERERLLLAARSHAEAAERQAHRMELVHRIASVLSARLDQQEVLDLAARELVQLFWADHTGTVILHDEAQGYVAAEYPATGIVGVELDLRSNLVLQRISTTRRPVVITDIDHDPLAAYSRELWRALGIQSLVIVPLISRDRVFGSISLDSYQGPLIFSDEELELMMTVATAIAAAYENALLFSAEQEQRRTADTLREMARVLSSSFDPDEVLRLVLDELGRLISFDTASIMLLDGTQLRMVAFKGWEPNQEPRGLSLPIEGTAAGAVVRRREPLRYVSGQSEIPWSALPTASSIRSWIGVPLIARGRVLGVLNIDSRIAKPLAPEPPTTPGRVFTERDIEVARTFANHAALAIENASLYQESVTRVEQELEIAHRIQSNLFPRELPAIHGLTLAARCLPARETGGDFYDLIDLGTRAGVIVGDVSGKSLPAAMLMAVARSTTRSEARNHETPWVVLTETNRWLVDDVPRNNFVALSYAVIDPHQGRMTMASAGQLAPLLRRADGSTSYLDGLQSLPMGLSHGAEFGQFEVELVSGDTLLFYTDGIVEAHDQNRRLFGFDRLEELVRVWGGLPPDELLDRIIEAVHGFSAGAPTHDDMTLVVVRVH
ncbi:MAG: GAF domain-containing protein [Oscillochloridaceae bacterium umkhey_bin13]